MEVEFSLRDFKAVKKVMTDSEKRVATVTYAEGGVTIDQMKEKLDAEGFTVDQVTPVE